MQTISSQIPTTPAVSVLNTATTGPVDTPVNSINIVHVHTEQTREGSSMNTLERRRRRQTRRLTR